MVGRLNYKLPLSLKEYSDGKSGRASFHINLFPDWLRHFDLDSQGLVVSLDGHIASRQSSAFSKRNLSQAIPQFHVERMNAI